MFGAKVDPVLQAVLRWSVNPDRVQHMPSQKTPQSEIVPGVRLGRADEVFSPAFWGEMARGAGRGSYGDIRLGADLAEEVAACLLGGFGMPAEMGLAAFDRLKERQLLYPGVRAAALEAALWSRSVGRCMGGGIASRARRRDFLRAHWTGFHDCRNKPAILPSGMISRLCPALGSRPLHGSCETAAILIRSLSSMST